MAEVEDDEQGDEVANSDEELELMIDQMEEFDFAKASRLVSIHIPSPLPSVDDSIVYLSDLILTIGPIISSTIKQTRADEFLIII
jgi:hypothetical protein